MSDTAAPAATATEAPAQPSLMDAIAAQGIPQDNGQPLPTAQPQKPAQNHPLRKEGKEKPAATKPQTEQPQRPVDRIPSLEIKEDAPEEQPETTENQQAQDGDDIKQQKTWDKYRNGYKEWEKVKPEYENLRKEKEAWAAKQAEFEQYQKELEDHRQFRAAYDWQNSPEYREQVAAPMAEQWRNAAQVADYLGADKYRLEQAMLEPNPLRRDELIEAVLAETGKEVKPAALQRVCDAATELIKLNAKGEAMEQKALDLQSAIKGRTEQETLRQKQESEAKWNEASRTMAGLYETKFAPLFAKNPELKAALQNARLAEDPMDQAMQAQSAEVLPVVSKALVEAMQEVASLKAKIRAMNGSKPTLGGERAPDTTPGEKQLSLQEAVAMHNSGRW